MQKEFYPEEIIEFSKEHLLSHHSRGSMAIYLSLLLLFGSALISLPFIKTEITVRAQGIIRPEIEKQEIRSQLSGIIAQNYLADNRLVKVGDTLVVFNSDDVKNRVALLSYTKSNLDTLIHDLSLLTAAQEITILKPKQLFSLNYRQELSKYRNEAGNYLEKINNQQKELDKIKQLFERDMTSRSAVENCQAVLKQLQAEEKIMQDQYLSRWLGDLKSFKAQKEQVDTDKQQLDKEVTAHLLLAPVTGHVELPASLVEQQFIQAGQTICVISPDAKLLAELYVSPKDIGLIKPGSRVTILADAYNYNDWGTIPGTVTEISSDYQLINQTPFFKIKCSLDRDFLRLKNGTIGKLKKGITLQARFAVSKRSLLQLLTDSANDWLNPDHSPQN